MNIGIGHYMVSVSIIVLQRADIGHSPSGLRNKQGAWGEVVILAPRLETDSSIELATGIRRLAHASW